MRGGNRQRIQGDSKRTKLFGLVLCAVLLTLCFSAEAQQPKKVARIGLLSGGANPAKPVLWEPFFEALREFGYVEGQNVILERRFADGKSERVPEFAAELVRLKVDLIVATGTTETREAKRATSMIPIVMVTAPDPVESGLVTSLARPGGNVTGLSLLAPELTGKRLELLRETIPKSSRFALLAWADDSTTANLKKDAELAAQALGIQIRAVEVGDADKLPSAFAGMALDRVQGLMVPFRLPFFNQRERIVDLAAKNRIPAIYDNQVFTEAGGLMAYGPRPSDLYRRAVVYVDKILKGSKPADLPVEQPKKFELAINLKAAKQIGLVIPPNVLARADTVNK
jgi:ABC-type uncharacterized transport system substrate-binding protein